MDMNALSATGLPLHACCGYVHDEHYWAWVRHLLVAKGLSNIYPNDVHPNEFR